MKLAERCLSRVKVNEEIKKPLRPGKTENLGEVKIKGEFSVTLIKESWEQSSGTIARINIQDNDNNFQKALEAAVAKKGGKQFKGVSFDGEEVELNVPPETEIVNLK